MNKKIWIWNHYATDMFKNKGGRHYWFAENLIKEGFEVTIFCSNTYHNSSDVIIIDNNSLFSTETINDIKFVFIKTTSTTEKKIDRVINMYSFYRNIKKVAKKFINDDNKPNYILASSVHPLTMLAGVQIGKKYHIPNISEVRDLWPEAIFQFGYAKESSIIGRLLTAGEKYIYQNSNALIFTKPGDKDYLIENKWTTRQGGTIDMESTYYINNGLDLEAFYAKQKNKKLNDNDLEDNTFKVVYTGTIRPVNNVDLILDAAKMIKEIDDIKFLIYGSGSEVERIQKRIDNENIKNVNLKGRIDKSYIPYVLNQSSVNLLNYSQKQYNWKRGNSSNKLFEYMASGKPIISTVKMGYSFINKYECGIELEENNAKSLSEAIKYFYSMDMKTYNQYCNNSKNAAKNFDMQVLTDKVISIINKI